TPEGPACQAITTSRLGPRLTQKQGLHSTSFRGSFTRLWCSLSTLRRMGRPTTTQDSLPAAGQALPGRNGYLLGCDEKFRIMPSVTSSSSFPKLSWRKVSSFALQPRWPDD